MTGNVAPGTALSTTPPLALWNPPGNRFEFLIKRLEVALVSGTLGAGHLMYATAAQPAAPTTGTPLTASIRGQRLGTPLAPAVVNASTAQAFQGSTIVAPAAHRPAQNIGSPDIPPAEDLGFSLLPGQVLSIEEVGAAGSSPLVRICLVWAEYQIG
jgi:hypothetical protein